MNRWPVLVLFALAGPAAADEKPKLVVESGGHHAKVTAVAFTPDSKRLVTASLDRTVRVWDAASGLPIRTLHFPVGPGTDGELLALAVSPDGKRLAAAGHGYDKVSPVYLVSLETYQVERVLKEHAHPIRALAFGGKGEVLAAGDDSGEIRIWDAGGGKVLRTLTGHKGGTVSVAFDPAGSRLASVGGDRAGRIWDVGSGTAVELKNDGTFSPRHSVAWSQDGKHIATAVLQQEGKNWTSLAEYFALWNPDGTLARKVAHQGNRKSGTEGVAFTPDSAGVVETAGDSTYAFARRFDVASGAFGKLYFDPAHKGDPHAQNHTFRDTPRGACATSADGKLLAVAGDRNNLTYVYDLKGGGLLRKIGGEGRQITELVWAAVEGGRTFVWKTELPGQYFDASKPIPEKFFDRAFVIPATGDIGLVSVPAKDVPVAWHQFALPSVWLEHKGPVLGVQHGAKVEQPPVLRAKEDVTNSQWVPKSGYTLLSPTTAVMAKADGLYLFDFGTKKGAIAQSLKFSGHGGTIRAVAPSPDGSRYLLGGGDDQVLHVWDPAKPDPVLNLFVAGPHWVAWTPSGHYAATLGGERLMGWVVNNGIDALATFHPAERFRERLHKPDVVRAALLQGVAPAAVATAVEVEALVPPKVELKQVGMKNGEVTVEVLAESKTASQPITAVRLYLDGKPLDDSQYRVAVNNQKKHTQQWKVTVPPGRHDITAMARGADTGAKSESLTVVQPLPAGERPALHLVAVGVNVYQQQNLTLKCAANDANDIVKAFTAHCAGPANRYALREKPVVLTDKEATKAGIRAALAAVAKQAKGSDTVVVFFAGHGVKEGNQFYLLPHEASTHNLAGTAISGAEFREMLSAIKVPTLLILDACHSTAAVKNMLPATDDATRSASGDEVGVTVLSAAMGKETAGEQNGNGFLTRGLMKALKGGPDTPFDAYDQTMYIHHLFSVVSTEVRRESEGKQNPFMQMPWTAPPLAIRIVRPPGK